MKRYFPGALLLMAMVYICTTGFQCGSAELTSAKLYIQQKQWAKAEESLQKQIAKNDKDEEAWYLLGAVRLETRNYLGMNDAYTHALAISEVHKTEISKNRMSSWATLYNEGVNYYNRGRDTASYYDKALDDFRTAAAIMPDSANTYYVTSLAYYAKHDNDGARKSLETALAKKPDFGDAAKFLGQLDYVFAQGKMEAKDTAGAVAEYTKAGEAFKTAYDANPNDTESLTNLIDSYERSHQIDKAASLTRDAVQKDPKNKLFRYALGVFLLKRDEYSGAVEQFNKALELDPSYTDATYNLGVAYLNWGVQMKADIDKKAETEKKGSKSGKDDTSYKEKFKLALPYLEEGVKSRPEDAALWTQLARLYAILNMPEKSKDAFAKVDSLTKVKK
ncbi:MAG TPA: tetratricopeptide repeat protein [Bacteroidota bacterium]|nr:tetratricopeptide repeat protein [Bacteroidota bacterium]